MHDRERDKSLNMKMGNKKNRSLYNPPNINKVGCRKSQTKTNPKKVDHHQTKNYSDILGYHPILAKI